MPPLRYIGRDESVAPNDPNNSKLLIDLRNTKLILDNLPINRGLVDTQISTKQALYATQTTLTTRLTQYVQYGSMVNDLNKCVPTSWRGAPNGVATTDTLNRVPLSQIPSLGDGYALGPFGCTQTFAASTGGAPVKIAQWVIGPGPLTFQPLVFMVVNARTSEATAGRTVVEVRISDGPASGYSTSNPLVAIGTGRSYYTSNQPIVVMSCSPSLGQVGTTASYLPTYNTHLTAWMYDYGAISTVTASAVVAGSAYLMKVAP